MHLCNMGHFIITTQVHGRFLTCILPGKNLDSLKSGLQDLNLGKLWSINGIMSRNRKYFSGYIYEKRFMGSHVNCIFILFIYLFVTFACYIAVNANIYFVLSVWKVVHFFFICYQVYFYNQKLVIKNMHMYGERHTLCDIHSQDTIGKSYRSRNIYVHVL